MCMQKLTTNNVTAPDEALLCGQVSMGYTEDNYSCSCIERYTLCGGVDMNADE